MNKNEKVCTVLVTHEAVLVTHEEVCWIARRNDTHDTSRHDSIHNNQRE